jgi:hypothetical protein
MVFVVIEVFQGVLQRVYGPFGTLEQAEKRAREICPEPDYDSDEEPQEYPATPNIEVFVYEASETGGTNYLALAK